MNPDQKKIERVNVPNPVKLEGQVLKDAIKTDFGIEIMDIEEIDVGFKNRFFRATTTQEKKIFIAINKDKAVIEVELFGYELLKQKGILVPEVITYQENPPTLGSPTAILSAARGVNLEDANLPLEQENAIYEKIGEILRKINEIKIEGFGPLRKVDGVFRGEYDTYEKYCEWRKETFDKAVGFLREKKLITPKEVEKLNKILKEISALNLEQSYLLHRHMRREHVFIDQGEISGIIDLARLAAGDPRYDIALSLLSQNERLQKYFKKGYGELANDPVVLKYLATTIPLKIMWRINRNEGRKESAEKLLTILRKILNES